MTTRDKFLPIDEVRKILDSTHDDFMSRVEKANKVLEEIQVKESKHPKCAGYYDEWNGDYGCHYNSSLSCDECKYGLGRRDPEAKCNQN
jgi:hypothetical protein